MKLTKFNHSAFTVEKDGDVLVVDPGVWSMDFETPDRVVAVVVTHEHADHFDPNKLHDIIEHNPAAIIYAPAAVADQAPDLPVQAVSAKDEREAGGFHLKFVGGTHATIHADFHPEFQNVGVIIDDRIYHPGDSLFVPDQPIKILSLPITAPWEKASDSMNFLVTIKPELAFPSHDAILSELGIGLYDRWHQMTADKHGISYRRLDGPIEI